MLRMAQIFLAFTLILAVAGCVRPQSVEPPGIALQNVRILKAEGLMQRLEIVLEVSNPNDFDIPLKGLEFAMQLNGLDFAEGLANDRITIPRLGRATVPVEVNVSLISVFQQLQAVQKNGRLDYQIAGKVFLDHMLVSSVPFDREGTVVLDRKSGTPRFEPI